MIRKGTRVVTFDPDGDHWYGKIVKIHQTGTYKDWAVVKYDSLKVERLVPMAAISRSYR